MTRHRALKTVSELEREILRVLCRSDCAARDWSNLTGQLTGYSWQEPDHQVVFDALRGIRSPDAKTRRDQLPAQATRMGFPDIDWSLYLDRRKLSGPAIEILIRRLKAETSGRP